MQIHAKAVRFYGLPRIGTVLSDDVLGKVIKYYSPDISGRQKFLKLLKYFEKQFPLETCTYFSSMEIKKSLGIEEGPPPEDGERTGKLPPAERMLRKRVHTKNPVLAMENNLRLEKYDKIRYLRSQRVDSFQIRRKKGVSSTCYEREIFLLRHYNTLKSAKKRGCLLYRKGNSSRS